jgi:hypothetical protein
MIVRVTIRDIEINHVLEYTSWNNIKIKSFYYVGTLSVIIL